MKILQFRNFLFGSFFNGTFVLCTSQTIEIVSDINFGCKEAKYYEKIKEIKHKIEADVLLLLDGKSSYRYSKIF